MEEAILKWFKYEGDQGVKDSSYIHVAMGSTKYEKENKIKPRYITYITSLQLSEQIMNPADTSDFHVFTVV